MSTTSSTKVDGTTKTKLKAPAPSGAGGLDVLTNMNMASKFDPFGDAEDPFGGRSGAGTPSVEQAVTKDEKIHVRVQQRNGRKVLTTVQGLPKMYDAKKLLKAMKKEFACNGTVVSQEEADAEEDVKPVSGKTTEKFGNVIQLQGDQRQKVKEFLISSGLLSEKELKEKLQLHGY